VEKEWIGERELKEVKKGCMDRWNEKWKGWKRDGLVEGDMEGMD
jgi:hypothetical protein